MKPLPCPFCGSDPEIGKMSFGANMYSEIRCTNKNCFIRPLVAQYKTKESSIKHWNKRVPIIKQPHAIKTPDNRKR
jgi:hypothetical protein